MKNIMIGMIAVILGVSTATADVVRPVARPTIEQCPEQADEMQCAKCAVYHEARGESLEGQVAVALTLFNRVESPRFPDTMCEVVWQKGYVRSISRWIGQFSFTTDGASDTMNEIDAIKASEAAVALARIVYEYDLEEEFNGMNKDVLWYHTDAVKPNWSQVYDPVVMIGNHMFYSDAD